MNEIIETMESNVRSYSRHFPMSFTHGRNEIMVDEEGNRYIDFFAGAGTMNFGHNNPYIKGAILAYLKEDRIIHALDMCTRQKKSLLETFQEKILVPRGLDYKLMSCGPTGTNGVEAALKLARKVTGRSNVFSFTGAFHGMTLGALSVTSGDFSRQGAGLPLGNATFMPYYNMFENEMDSVRYLENILQDDHSGVEKPAAIILETIQAEGGINVAPVSWLQEIRALCSRHEILLIVDDIQVGVGRSGSFFSFERANIVPDMVILSKSISGFGLPLSFLLIKPEIDCFAPAEHNGTFRGNQLGFVGCQAAIEYYCDHDMDQIVREKGAFMEHFIQEEICRRNGKIKYRGLGMIWGVDLSVYEESVAREVQRRCVEKHLIIERAGRKDQVIKLLPSLLIEQDNLQKGMEIIRDAIVASCERSS